MSSIKPLKTLFGAAGPPCRPPFGYISHPPRDYDAPRQAQVPVEKPAIRIRGVDEEPYTREQLYRMVTPPANPVQARNEGEQPPRPEVSPGPDRLQ